MQAQRPTFMLLPDFGYAPEDIQLGTLLSLSGKTKLPDPGTPLNDVDRIVPSATEVHHHVEHNWVFHNRARRCWSAGIEADVPVFLPAGGGISYGVSRDQDLAIECEVVETAHFNPSPAYIATALATDFVQDYCRMRWRPSVYMVTGLKTARQGMVTSVSRRSLEGNLKGRVDATTIGVPLNAGPALDMSRLQETERARHIPGPFLLAYQLKRVRMSRKGTAKSAEGFNKFALFDDEPPAVETEWHVLWDSEDVLPETEHDV